MMFLSIYILQKYKSHVPNHQPVIGEIVSFLVVRPHLYIYIYIYLRMLAARPVFIMVHLPSGKLTVCYGK